MSLTEGEGRLAVRGPTGCRYLDDPRQADYVAGWLEHHRRHLPPRCRRLLLVPRAQRRHDRQLGLQHRRARSRKRPPRPSRGGRMRGDRRPLSRSADRRSKRSSSSPISPNRATISRPASRPSSRTASPPTNIRATSSSSTLCPRPRPANCAAWNCATSSRPHQPPRCFGHPAEHDVRCQRIGMGRRRKFGRRTAEARGRHAEFIERRRRQRRTRCHSRWSPRADIRRAIRTPRQASPRTDNGPRSPRPPCPPWRNIFPVAARLARCAALTVAGSSPASASAAPRPAFWNRFIARLATSPAAIPAATPRIGSGCRSVI